ncbi:efflux RND transporter periplasmic adaptor subunit [Roseovarius sp. Pro17]|uniref:efflux RND transporter periplasmic adaptor subunit n=1 Tax=Roseovarius sp. Pro17 TaxID=3108175 RepID=UPI002D7891DC|nr:efflux RND transporter periplasmic adaptor subunit [Roseovarius sp. Pro17]
MTDTPTEGRKTLTFDSDVGSTRSRWVAGGLAVAIIGWMGSGYILPSSDPTPVTAASATPKAVTVAVRQSVAESVEQVFVAEGQALPDRDTAIRAETSGQIAELLVDKGAVLEAGQVIARFDTAARRSDLARAKEELNRAQREFDNASALVARGVATVDRVSEARATLAAAEAGVTTAEEAIGNTEIRAPFAGRLETLDIDTREFVSTGTDIGRIVDNTPLTIRIQIPQQSLSDIKVGQTAEVAFITGATGTGEVKFVGTSADVDTRTFLAEIEVPNEGGTIPAGISAQLRIPTGKLTAHFVSPAILSLDTDGTLGIKTVTADNLVEFHKISIVRAQTDGIWVSGLPDEAQIISIGQGFVNNGETVDPQPDGDDNVSAAQAPVPGAPEAKAAANGNGQIIATAPETDIPAERPADAAKKESVQ